MVEQYINDKQRARNYSTFTATSSFMFLAEYSILNVSIARSVALYSAQCSTINERIYYCQEIFLVISLNCWALQRVALLAMERFKIEHSTKNMKLEVTLNVE